MLPSRVPGDVARTGELIAGAAGASRRAAAAACPAPRRRAPAPAGVGTRTDRLGLAAEDHQHAPVGTELDDLARALVDDPDVVLRVDAHAVRDQEAVDALADLATKLPLAIELEEPRAAVREQPRVAEADGRIAGSRVDEDLPLRVGRHAGHLAEMDVGRHLAAVRRGVERDLRHRRPARRVRRPARGQSSGAARGVSCAASYRRWRGRLRAAG